MASVAIRDVRKAFGSTTVIHGVDVAISDGEFAAMRELPDRMDWHEFIPVHDSYFSISEK